MRSHVSRFALVVAFTFTLAALASGCGQTVTDALAASAMRVSIDIKDYHQGTTQVAVHFGNGKGDTVEFVHGETITCNGVYLKYDSGFFAHLFGYGAYTGETTLQPSGGAYTFVFTPKSGSPSTITIPIVAAPITSMQPGSGASVPVPSSAPLVVQYGPSGVSNSVIGGAATDSRGHLALMFDLTDNGSASFDLSGFKDFQPGPGTLTLSRVTSSKPGGTGFASLDVGYENLTTEQIVWS